MAEDPTCLGATKPVHHSDGADELQVLKPAPTSPCSVTRKATVMRSPSPQLESSPHTLQLEESPHSGEDLAQLKSIDA